MSSPLVRAALAASLATGLLTACESTPQRDISVLEGSRTPIPGSAYVWADVSAQARQAADPRVANDIIQERLRASVDTVLQSKGYRRVSNHADAQLEVAYHVGLQDRTETRVTSWGGGGGTACGFRGCVSGWGVYGPPMVDVDHIDYTEGTVILDLLDAGTGKLIWRSSSKQRIDKGDASPSRLNAMFSDMTKTLPAVPPPAAPPASRERISP